MDSEDPSSSNNINNAPASSGRITVRLLQAQEIQRKVEKELHEKNLQIVELKTDLDSARDLLARRELEIERLQLVQKSSASYNGDDDLMTMNASSGNNNNNNSMSRNWLRGEAVKMHWFREMALLELQEQIARNTMADSGRDDSFELFSQVFFEVGKQHGDEEASERLKHRINTLMFQLRVSQSMHVKKLRKQLAEMSAQVQVQGISQKNNNSNNNNQQQQEKNAEEMERQQQQIALLQKEVEEHEKRQLQNEQEIYAHDAASKSREDAIEQEVQRRVNDHKTEFDDAISKLKKSNQKVVSQMKQFEAQLQAAQQASALISEESKKWEDEAKKLRTQNRILTHQNKEQLQQIQLLQSSPKRSVSSISAKATTTITSTNNQKNGNSPLNGSNINQHQSQLSKECSLRSNSSDSSSAATTTSHPSFRNIPAPLQQVVDRHSPPMSSSRIMFTLQQQEEQEVLLDNAVKDRNRWKNEAEQLQVQLKEYEGVIATIQQEEETRQKSEKLVSANTNNNNDDENNNSNGRNRHDSTKSNLSNNTERDTINETDESSQSYQQQQQISQLQFWADDLQSQLASSQMKLQEAERRLVVFQQQQQQQLQRSPSVTSVVGSSSLFPVVVSPNYNHGNVIDGKNSHQMFQNSNINNNNNSVTPPDATPTKLNFLNVSSSSVNQQQQQQTSNNGFHSPRIPSSLHCDEAEEHEIDSLAYFANKNSELVDHLDQMLEYQMNHFSLVSLIYLQNCEFLLLVRKRDFEQEYVNILLSVKGQQFSRENSSVMGIGAEQQKRPEEFSEVKETTTSSSTDERERIVTNLRLELEEEAAAKIRAKRRHGEEIEDLEQRLDTVKTKYAQLENENKTGREKLSLANTEAASAQERSRDLERKLAAERDHNATSKDKIGGLETELDAAKRAALDTRKEFDEARAKHATELVVREGEFDRSRQKLLSQIGTMQEELSALKLQQHSQQMDHMSELHKVERHKAAKEIFESVEATSFEKQSREQVLLSQQQKMQQQFFSSSLDLYDSYFLGKSFLLLMCQNRAINEAAAAKQAQSNSKANANNGEDRRDLEEKYEFQLQRQIIKYEAEKEELSARILELQAQKDQQSLFGGMMFGAEITSPETMELICELRNKLADTERALRMEKSNRKP